MNAVPGTLSVVICAYTEDRWPDLSAAVQSVRDQEPPAHEIVVVTDHNDALYDRACAGLVGARVVQNAEAQGLSGARNTGIEASTGSIIAFLDDDAMAEPGWIAHLLAPYANPDVLGVGGRVVPRWDDARPSWLPEEFDWVVGCTYTGHRDDAGPVRNLIGANMSVRRDIVTTIGGFKHSLGRTASLPAGCEETEFFIRATQSFPNGVVWFEPEAAVSHRVPVARATTRYFRARCFAEGISKTQISRLVGTQEGLASEREYTTRTLPRAVVRELGLALRTGDGAGVSRAATVVTGVATTAGGYAAARIPGAERLLPTRNGQPRRKKSKRLRGRSYEPALVTQIDIAHGIDALSAQDPFTGNAYARAVVLVRNARKPVGVLELAFGPEGLSAAQMEREITGTLGIALPDPDATGAPGIAIVHERPRTAVVIATRDRPESLARCLESLRDLDHPADEIVVVDNASSGRETVELVESAAATDPRFKYVREDRPGLARAHNSGLEHVSSPIVAFTDDDVVADRAWLHELIDGFSLRSNVGCVTGMIFPLELETAAQDWLEHYAGFNKGFEPRIFDQAEPSADPLFPYTAGALGSGANMAFRTDVLQSMRGFEPALGAGTEAKGGDDLAAFFDVITAGHTIAYQPGAIIYHQHHRTFEALQRQTFGYGAGLTAYLTKTVVEQPNRALDMLSRAPRALHHALSPSSTKNARLPYDTPSTLVRRERVGMLVGPALYFLSRWDTRFDDRPEPGSTLGSDLVTLNGAQRPEVDVDLVEMDLREASAAR